MWKCALALPTTSHNPIPISAPSERRGSFFGAYQSSTIVAGLPYLIALPFPENICKMILSKMVIPGGFQMHALKKNSAVSFIIIAAVYILAAVLGIWAYLLLP